MRAVSPGVVRAAPAPVATRVAMVATGPPQTGLFTGSKPSDRHIEPDDLNGRTQFKVVYVVLESQYQSSMTAACKRINAQQEKVAVECSGYLLEELRDPVNYEAFKKEVAEADIFIGSLIFVQELADKVVEAVAPHRDSMSACIIFPSMPDVMRLQKVGTFEMKNAGTSKGGLSDFMKKNKPNGATFEDGMLKLLRALPKVLKYLPNEKARDARSFMLSFQVRASRMTARALRPRARARHRRRARERGTREPSAERRPRKAQRAREQRARRARRRRAGDLVTAAHHAAPRPPAPPGHCAHRTPPHRAQYWLGGSPENLEAMLLNVASKYVAPIASNELLPESVIQDPRLIPDRGIWHPGAKEIFVDVDSYLDWYRREMAPANGIDFDTAPTVGILLQKSHINTKDDGHYVSLIQELEARGAKVVPTYSGALDFSVLIDEYFYSAEGKQAVDSVINLTGFALVGGPAKQDHPAAVECLRKLDRPYLCALPLVFQTFEEWKESELGLHPVQVALQVALPEIDGAIEPIIFAGRDGLTGRSVPLADRIAVLAERSLRWANLRRKPNAEKNVAITIFSFPPDKGNVGTAAYLDVFGSIFSVLKGLKKDGYDVGDVPETIEALIDSVLHDKEARIASPELNVEYRMSVDEYRRLTPWASDLEENWGPPPGQLNSDGQNLLIYGKKFGNVFIGVQPSFGYEGDPMRLLFSKSASPHHGFAAYYTYVEKVFGADAVLHFGTHGSLEFMPGKQVGMSGECYPDRLIHNIPNLYYYAANNPSEATIAKRRSYANTISYLTPPAENAGLYKGLKELGELVASYQTLRDTGRGSSIVGSIVAAARTCNLDKDIKDLPSEEADFTAFSLDDRDTVVGKVYARLMEIESRLLPCGLHTVGVPPTAEEAIATLVSIASIDRAEENIKSLPRILAASVGRDIDDIYRRSDAGVLDDVTLRTRIVEATRAAVRAMVEQSVNNEGRIETVASVFGNFARMLGIGKAPWVEACATAGFDAADEESMKPLFTYLDFCLKQIVADNELGALLASLQGRYTLPGPGGDPIRNPLVLPTGKNMHALDPQAIPTAAACDCAKVVVDRLLERQALDNNGAYPESIAFVLWGTDNIKTYGESLAQVLWMVGVKPVADSIGRVNKLELIPLEKLGRPRIDVVVSCSGVFRDLFINQVRPRPDAPPPGARASVHAHWGIWRARWRRRRWRAGGAAPALRCAARQPASHPRSLPRPTRRRVASRRAAPFQNHVSDEPA